MTSCGRRTHNDLCSRRHGPHGHGPADWWLAFRSRLEIESGVEYRGEYAITVEVGTTWTVRAATSGLKPMLDGLVSALHVHDGTGRDHIVGTLERYGNAEGLWELLNTPDAAILGRRPCCVPAPAALPGILRTNSVSRSGFVK